MCKSMQPLQENSLTMWLCPRCKMPVGQSRTSNSELEMIEKQTIKQMYNQPGYLSSDNYVQKCPLIRCTLISVSVTNCPLALLPNFNITRFQEYRQLLKVSPKCCFQGREDEGRQPIPCPTIVFFFFFAVYFKLRTILWKLFWSHDSNDNQ